MPDINYEINITKAGTGATAAADELKQLAAAEKEVTAAAQSATAATTQHDAATTKQGNGLGDLASRWLTVGAALSAITRLTHEAISAAVHHEETVDRLNGILQATGQYSAAVSQELQKLSAALAEQTGHTHDEVTAVEALLLSFGAARKDLPALTQLVLDLSAGLGKSLPEASLMVGKALEGNFSAFKKLGVEVDAHKTVTENLNSVLLQLQERFNGVSEAMAQGAAGQFKKTQSAAHELSVELGETLLPTLNTLLHGFNALANNQTIQNAGAAVIQYGWGLAQRIQNTEPFDVGLLPKKAPTPGPSPSYQPRSTGEQFGPFEPDGPPAPSGPAAHAGLASGGSVSAAADAVNEEQIKAVEKLTALEEKMRIGSLDGYAKELEVAQATHDKQAALLTELAHVAADKASQERVANDQLANDEELAAAKRRVAAQQQAELDRLYEQQKRDQARLTHEELKNFEEDLKIKMLTASGTRRQIAEQEYQARLAEYRKLLEAGTMTEEAYTQKVREASQKRQEAVAQEAHDLQQQYKQLGNEIEDMFANKASAAIVKWAQTGKFEAKQFFADLLAQIAQAIIQMEILLLVKTLVRSLGGGGIASGGGDSTALSTGTGPDMPSQPGLLADGGVRLAANGIMGMTTGPVMMPKFNVLAGEAGPEMLAVLARPRSVTVAGVQAAIGDVGSRRMALVNASALNQLAGARPQASGGVTYAADGFAGSSGGGGGGVGGQATIVVQLEPGLRAQIIEQALAGVAVQLSRPSPISKGVKELARS